MFAASGLEAGVASVGTTSANFLKIAYDARPAAMGEAFTAISDDESAFQYNPSGIAQALQTELSATHIEWFQGINLEHLGGIWSLGSWGTAGAGLTWLSAGTLVATQRGNASDSNPLGYQEIGTFNPYDMALNFNWAYQPVAHWNVGAGVRLIQQAIDTSSGWGANLDLGVQRTGMFGWLDAGAVVQNLGTSIAVGSTSFSQPLDFKAGLAGRLWGGKVNIAADITVPTDDSVIPSLGAEWWVAQPLALRAGWMGGYASQPTAGLGIRFSMFLLDYAYQPYSELGDTHRITASLVFGGPGTSVKALRPLLGPLGDPEWRMGGFEIKPDKPDAVVSWNLSLLAADGSVERTWTGEGPAAPLKVDWDGKDAQGQVLPDAFYTVRLDLLYRGAMKAHAVSGPVELDSTPPKVTLGVQPIVARPNAQGAVLVPAHIQIGATDKNGVGGWKLDLKDKGGNVFRSFSGDGQPPQDLVWDGTDGQGKYIDSGSTYFFWPSAKDTLGNWGKGEPQALIVLLKEVHFDIASDALFEPGKADVRISAYHQLSDVKALILKTHEPGTKVDIVGHTDNTPVVHSVYHDNMALSLARAQAVVKFLVTLLDMDPNILNPVGMGDTRPKTTNDTPEGREANRRVEVVVHAKEYR
jgi:outer membrane protein OmpA-like peptidoglycan-associated protein